jgi:O-antigen ligase
VRIERMQTRAETNQSVAIPLVQHGAGALDAICGLLALAILLAILVTFNPFSDLSDADPLQASSGKEAHTYLAFAALLAVSGLLLHLAGRLHLNWLVSKANLLLLGWIVIAGVALSNDPATSARRFALSLMTFLLAALLPWLTRGSRQFANLLMAAAAVVLTLSYLGVLFAPQLTIHQVTDIGEPEIAGAWRGIFGHKNIAAGVMAVFIYVGWYAARMGRPLGGTLVALAAFVFLIFSEGKSALGLVFVVAFIAWLVDRAPTLWAKVLIAFGPLALIHVFTIGASMSGSIAALTAALPIDATFTGRTEIWSFAIDAITAQPFKGHGFEAFWYSDSLRYGVESSNLWMAAVATSHNSYVDLALTIGIPGLALVALALLVSPLRDFHRRLPENGELARLFLLLWLFPLYLGTFEAFFLSRANPMWFVLALAVCGLRCTALFVGEE